tara:strand:- start:292 stop:1335 length:1044 start_codon:yes stop_codon:yes gene_type:complete
MANPFIAIAAAITGITYAIYTYLSAEEEVIETTEEAVDAKKELVVVTDEEKAAAEEAAKAEAELAASLSKVEKAVVKVNTAVGLNVMGLVGLKDAAEDIPEGLKGFKFDTGGGDAPQLKGGRPDMSSLPAAEVGSVSGIETAAAGLDTMSNKVASFAAEYGEAINGIFEVFNLGIENQNLKLDEQHAKELQRINGSKKSEEEKAKAIEKLEKKTDEKRTKLKRKQAIADKAAAISQAIINTAVQVAAVVANPALAILVGALGAMQVGMIASQPIPFADGGLVTGPTMGLVGEGRGTTRSNPEVIAPLDKLKGMINGGSQEVIVRGVISGDDLLLVHDRAVRKDLRIG